MLCVHIKQELVVSQSKLSVKTKTSQNNKILYVEKFYFMKGLNAY